MAGIGEVLWDLLPEGRQLGGSPLNVVYHCQLAGIQSVVVSAIGQDAAGVDILELFTEKKLDPSYLQRSSSFPTGAVTVELDQGIPNFIIHPDVAWDAIQWNDSLQKLAQSLDAVAFGSLPQRNPLSRETIRKFLKQLPENSLKVFDINLRQNFHSAELLEDSLNLCNILKINDEELPVLTGYLGIKGSIDQQIQKILTEFQLKMIAFTEGARGSKLFTPTAFSVLNAPKVPIRDTVGAGDAFTGVLIAGLLHKKSLKEIHKEATQTAAWVCSEAGAMPELGRRN